MGQYCLGTGEEEEAVAGCSWRCPFWGGLELGVMGTHRASGAPDPSAWQVALGRDRGMTGPHTAAALKPSWQWS